MRKRPVALSWYRSLLATRVAAGIALADIFVASASAFPLDVSFPPVLLTHWRMDAHALVLESDAATIRFEILAERAGNPSLLR